VIAACCPRCADNVVCFPVLAPGCGTSAGDDDRASPAEPVVGTSCKQLPRTVSGPDSRASRDSVPLGRFGSPLHATAKVIAPLWRKESVVRFTHRRDTGVRDGHRGTARQAPPCDARRRPRPLRHAGTVEPLVSASRCNSSTSPFVEAAPQERGRRSVSEGCSPNIS
jgi:hypothetical protein